MGFGGDEYSGGVKKRERNWFQAFFPVIGLIMFAIAGVLAYILSTPAYDFLVFQRNILPAEPPELQIFVGVVIFLVIIMLYAFVYALLAPKPTKIVTEAQLDKEKQQKLKEDAAAKRRKREMRNKMRKRNRK